MAGKRTFGYPLHKPPHWWQWCVFEIKVTSKNIHAKTILQIGEFCLLDIVNCREEFFLCHYMFLVSLVSFHLCTGSSYPDLHVGPGAAIDVKGAE